MTMAEFTGQTYGEASRQRASQRVVRPGPPPTEGGQPEITLPPFDRPTEMPDQPITAGMGQPPAIGIQPGSDQDLMLRVRAIASRFPNPALLQLVQEMERRSGMA